MKILVVDDDEMTLHAISKKLIAKGYEVEPAHNSIEAIKAISDQKFDIVISDIIMPCISGFTLLVMLKSFYFLKAPVILISSFTNENILLRLRSLGASDFIAKPIDFSKLILKIENCTKNLSSSL